jgi:hypothetical protein
MRHYTHGSAWALWRWTVIDWKDEPYLTRLHLFKTPWFALMLHWFHAPDPHMDPHDHPVSFISLTVRGGYTEWRTPHVWSWGSYNRRRLRFTRAHQVHKVVAVLPGTVTLVLAGPVVRHWGYHTTSGFVNWKVYRERFGKV